VQAATFVRAMRATNMSGVVMARRAGHLSRYRVPDRFIETFLVDSWAEHLRQHARQTQADRTLEDRIRTLVRGESKVQHLIDAGRDITAHARSDD
jgi:hypothetical protein